MSGMISSATCTDPSTECPSTRITSWTLGSRGSTSRRFAASFLTGTTIVTVGVAVLRRNMHFPRNRTWSEVQTAPSRPALAAEVALDQQQLPRGTGVHPRGHLVDQRLKDFEQTHKCLTLQATLCP